MEAAVTAARIAVSDSKGVVFVFLAMGEAGRLRVSSPPVGCLARWPDRIETACLNAMRYLDDIEMWATRVGVICSAIIARSRLPSQHAHERRASL
jgi:hypothetical protein